MGHSPALRFGTDGVRGVANVELTPEAILALGRSIARVLWGAPSPGAAASVVVGRDTRRSGPLLQAALSAGLAAEGVSVSDVGVLPTPGIAHLAALRGVPAAVVSASHNPFADNGVKVFAAGGTKLGTGVEAAIEACWHQILAAPAAGAAAGTAAGAVAGTAFGPAAGAAFGPAAGTAVGRIADDPEAAPAYSAHLVGCLGGRRLGGLSVVLDCANGAASAVAPGVLASLGAQVAVIAAAPDGANINHLCGSTHPERLQAAVLSHGADLGLAFDGDADRCLAVDAGGALVDGDHLMAMFALDLHERGELDGDAIAVTVMSNLGLRLAMEAAGIGVVETPVGDRHVLDAMGSMGLVLGGEQSGHLVFRRLATTGDGILTGLLLADLVVRRGRPLAEIAGGAMTRLPQYLASVALPTGLASGWADLLAASSEVREAVAAVRAELGTAGRVLLRPSGTEPLVRVMAEATTAERAVAVVEQLCSVVRRELGPDPAS